MHKSAQRALLESQLWEVYQQSYFRSVPRVRPWSNVCKGRAGAIISTWNPYGCHNTHSANLRLTRAYLKYLSNHNHLFELLWGGDEDMLYRELSVFVPCDFKTAQHLSKKAKQLAFYYVSRRARVTLCSTLETKPIAFVTDDIRKRWQSNQLPKYNQALCWD